MYDFWDWNWGDIVDFVGLGYVVCKGILNGVVFVEMCWIDWNVVGLFVIGGVFKYDIWEFGSNVYGWVYKVEWSGKDDVCIV